jgi:hypothetical protein
VSDSTNVQFDQQLVDYVPAEPTGYPDEWAARDTSEAYAGLGGMIDFPDHLWIEERDWKDVARQNDQYGTWPDDYRSRYTNQTPTHECTTHALVQNTEIAQCRQLVDKSKVVWLSPLSIYAEANPRRWGGSTMQRTLGIARDRGFLPDHDGPDGEDTQRDKFDATLHCTSGNVDYSSNGPWVSVDRFPNGWRETAKRFRPLEYVNVREWRQIICLLLNGYAVSVGRSGHAIPYTKIVWRGGRLHAQYADSYVIDRYDSLSMIKSAVGGAYSVFSVTAA